MAPSTWLYFDGCGGLYGYAFGVCACLEDHLPDELAAGQLGFKTISGSGFPVACLRGGRQVAEVYSLQMARFRYHSMRSGVTGLYKLISEHCRDALSRFGPSPAAACPHLVVVCGGQQVEEDCNFGETCDINHYVDALTASSFLPLADSDTPWFWRVNGVPACDGQFSNPKPSSDMVDVLQVLGYRSLSMAQKYFWQVAGFSPLNGDHLFTAGYDDAFDILLPMLSLRLQVEHSKTKLQRTLPVLRFDLSEIDINGARVYAPSCRVAFFRALPIAQILSLARAICVAMLLVSLIGSRSSRLDSCMKAALSWLALRLLIYRMPDSGHPGSLPLATEAT